jgi:hypothetical protein
MSVFIANCAWQVYSQQPAGREVKSKFVKILLPPPFFKKFFLGQSPLVFKNHRFPQVHQDGKYS